MVDIGRVQTPPTTQGMQAQTGSQSDKNRKPFDPELLNDEKAAAGVARELAQADSDSEIRTRGTTEASSTELATPQRDNAEWSRTEGAPNWSTLSASSKGYTFTERAINLYRHINAMPV